MDVHVAVLVDFSEGEVADVKAAAVVEVELRGHVEDGAGIHVGAESDALRGDAADRTGFDRQHEVFVAAFFAGDETNAVSNADAHVADGALLHFIKCAAGDNLALVERDLDAFAVVEREVARDEAVDRRAAVELRLGGINDHDVNEVARNADSLRVERSLLHHFLNLHHHDAAVVVDGFGDDKGVEVHHFVFEGGVAFAVAGRGADEGHIRRDGLVVEVFLAFEADEADQVLFGDVV